MIKSISRFIYGDINKNLGSTTSRFNFCIFYLLLICFIILYMIGYSPITGKILGLLNLFISLLFVYESLKKKNTLFFILFIYLLRYTYVYIQAFFDGLNISVYTDFRAPVFIYKTALLHLLFSICFYLNIKIPSKEESLKGPIYHNRIFYILNVVLLLFCTFKGRSGETVFSGVYGQLNNITSTLFEYGIIPFLGCLLFGTTKKHKLFNLILFATYSTRSLLFGGRIEIFMVSILIFIFYLKKINILQTTVLLVLGITLMGFLGKLRVYGSIYNMSEIYEQTVLSSKNKTETIINQEADVIYGASRIIALVDYNIVQSDDRVIALFDFCRSIITVKNKEKKDTSINLASYKSDVYHTGGGGLCFSYFYFFLSFLGVFLLARFLSFFISSFRNHKCVFINVYLLLFVTTLPRWYAYNPIFLFKFCIIGSIYLTTLICLSKKIKLQ